MHPALSCTHYLTDTCTAHWHEGASFLRSSLSLRMLSNMTGQKHDREENGVETYVFFQQTWGGSPISYI